MRWNAGRFKLSSGKAAFSAVLFGLLVFFTAAPRAAAEDWYKCQRRIEKQEWKLRREIERHGWYSRQAEKRRYELWKARDRCFREQGRWWDSRNHCWRYDRDGDRRYDRNWDRDWNRR